MAQRWPSASRPARDARMSRAPARGAPAVSAPEARRYTRVSPHAHNSLLPAHGAPRRQVRNPEGAEGGDGGGEALVDDRADRGRDVHRQNAPARPPCTNRTAPHRAVPCRAVPCRAVPCRAPFPQTHSPLSLRMGSNPRTYVLRPHAITAALIARVSPDALQKTLFVRSC